MSFIKKSLVSSIPMPFNVVTVSKVSGEPCVRIRTADGVVLISSEETIKALINELSKLVVTNSLQQEKQTCD